MNTTTARAATGWAPPRGGDTIAHWWRFDGLRMCAPSGSPVYHGPKLTIPPPVDETCAACVTALDQAAQALGLPFARLIEVLPMIGTRAP